MALRNRDAILLGLGGPECGDILYFMEEGFNIIHADSLSTQREMCIRDRVIELMSFLGAPVSTTQVITTSIMGMGSAKRFSAVKWGVAQNIVIAWVVTLPITMFLGGLAEVVLEWILF